ncbi:hypothetical protein [Siccirubricoccus phaeus]|uniref:hypothetical protein n=1 Tax=Siccirubricoccus phaeus TaxID=2595053 RepID=UPI0011F278FF|nr:hypothetical protein [Siccirubricoccus phaeus]
MVRVFLDDGGEKRLVGRADIPDDVGAVYELRLFGPASIIREQFTVGTVTHLGPGRLDLAAERVILLSPGQRPELLPGWQPLAS